MQAPPRNCLRLSQPEAARRRKPLHADRGVRCAGAPSEADRFGEVDGAPAARWRGDATTRLGPAGNSAPLTAADSRAPSYGRSPGAQTVGVQKIPTRPGALFSSSAPMRGRGRGRSGHRPSRTCRRGGTTAASPRPTSRTSAEGLGTRPPVPPKGRASRQAAERGSAHPPPPEQRPCHRSGRRAARTVRRGGRAGAEDSWWAAGSRRRAPGSDRRREHCHGRLA